MDSEILHYIGKSLYKLHTVKGLKRYLVFRARCRLHRGSMQQLLGFFNASEQRRRILRATPSFVEQATRSFFYFKSTWAERRELIRHHLLLLEELFRPELLELLYVENRNLPLWQSTWQEKPLSMELHFEGGQRKEGCLSLLLRHNQEALYQIIFWLGRGSDGASPVLYVGALQGLKNSSEMIRELTKAFYGYRTKNLIFYGLRSFAESIGAQAIYGVANEGYYAMNHLRLDRKLKTSFSDFWEECEGVRSSGQRFYKMPVAERRKAMEELKPSKRAQHRRRFEKMDEIRASVAQALAVYRK